MWVCVTGGGIYTFIVRAYIDGGYFLGELVKILNKKSEKGPIYKIFVYCILM